jgi:hypothetical protein
MIRLKGKNEKVCGELLVRAVLPPHLQEIAGRLLPSLPAPKKGPATANPGYWDSKIKG